MHKIDHATAPCLVCGTGNAKGSPAEDVPEFLDLERDVNWNDPAIICEDCGIKIGAQFGMLSGEERNTLRLEVSQLKEQLHDAKAETDALVRRARRLGLKFVDEKEKAVA